MSTVIKSILSASLFLIGNQVYSLHLPQGHFLLEGGAFKATQGETQKINIEGLVGDLFNVTTRHDSNYLLGLGYLINGYENDRFGIDYGINAFYLAKTQVFGTIDQELLFTNLGYSYSVHHVPVYATAKAHIQTSAEQFALTLDAGVGPNFQRTSNYHDWSIDNGMTLPDHAFSGRSDTTFTATAGVGIKFTPGKNHVPLECGYRFFYLGEGNFNARTAIILNTLKTGNSYAQALVCTVAV